MEATDHPSKHRTILRYQIDPEWEAESHIKEHRAFCREAKIAEVMLLIAAEELSTGPLERGELERSIVLGRRMREKLAENGVGLSLNPWCTVYQIPRGRRNRRTAFRTAHSVASGLLFITELALGSKYDRKKDGNCNSKELFDFQVPSPIAKIPGTMEYRQLGTTGLRVSKLCLGTMIGFKEDRQAECDAIVGRAIDAGVNFIDTADCYGPSEAVVGRALKNDGRRDDVVLATKFGWYVGKGPNDYGAGRRHIIDACERSLKRLQTDRIDLYILHVVDPNPPWEETLTALDDLVRAGKVRYIGCSKHPASMIVEALSVSDCNGLKRFASEQPPYNLLDRTAENELLPTARRMGLGITPFCPLAGGLLSGKYRHGKSADSGRYADSEPGEDEIYTPEALDAVEKLIPLAESKGLSLAEFSLAWLLRQPSVDSAIVGARKIEYLDSALKACEACLDDDDLTRVDDIVPPGSRVSNYYEAFIYRAFRQDYLSSARRGRGAGAFIPDHASGSDQEAGKN